MLRGVDTLTEDQVYKCISVGTSGIVAFPFATGLLFSSLLMLLWHVSLICSGQTTIEIFRFRLAPWVAGQGWGVPKFSYGVVKNVSEILWPETSVVYAHCEKRIKRD